MQGFVTSSPLVSAAWLAEHGNDSQVAIVDCRFNLAQPNLGYQQYQAGHLLGAHYLDLNRDLAGSVGLHGGRHPLPDVAALAQTLGDLGISSDPPTLVVAYDDSNLAFAARAWWLLRYLGHDRVAVLDGGFSGWCQAGYPVTTDLPAPQPRVFTPQVRSHWVVDIHQVKARKDQSGVVLVDSREPARYRGEVEPIDPIAGHIPGAVNYPWKDVTDAQGRVHPAAEQQHRWQSVQSAEEIIVYCGSGVTACVNLLSLELAGLQGYLYAGSWSDWCSYEMSKGTEA